MMNDRNAPPATTAPEQTACKSCGLVPKTSSTVGTDTPAAAATARIVVAA
jgi:hypothetical protein